MAIYVYWTVETFNIGIGGPSHFVLCHNVVPSSLDAIPYLIITWWKRVLFLE
jgi:hypothetical protein